MVGNAALMSNTPPARTATTEGPARVGPPDAAGERAGRSVGRQRLFGVQRHCCRHECHPGAVVALLTVSITDHLKVLQRAVASSFLQRGSRGGGAFSSA